MRVSKLSAIVTRYLLDLIMKGEVALGGKLPSTNNIAKITGTSILTVREAVQSLARIGILEITHGRGIFLTRGKPIFEDLLIARQVIESNSVLMATEKLDAGSEAKLADLLRQMKNKSRDPEAFSELDYEFHYYISNLAGNRILNKTLENIKELLHYQQLYVNRLSPSIIKQSLIRHQEIFETMKKKDARLASMIMNRHIAEVIESWNMMYPHPGYRTDSYLFDGATGTPVSPQR